MIHFRHGQLAHGVLGVFWVAAGEKDILYVTHDEESSGRRVRRLRTCCGGFGAGMVVRWKLLILGLMGSLGRLGG